MAKILTFQNNRASCEIGNSGTVKCRLDNKLVFYKCFDGFHVYTDASFGIYNGLCMVYDSFSTASPIHPGKDCFNCYQTHPILQKDICICEEDDIWFDIGMIGYCDRNTAVIYVLVYNRDTNVAIFDELFDYDGEFIYDEPLPKTSLKVPSSNSLYDELYKSANRIG